MTAALSDHDQHLAICAEHLRAVLTGEKVAYRTMQGMRRLLSAVAPGYALDPALKAEVSALLFAIVPLVNESVAGRMTPEHVAFSLGCANGVMDCMTAPRRWHLIAYAALLEAELKAMILRDRIVEDGDPDLVQMIHRNTHIAAPFWPGDLSIH